MTPTVPACFVNAAAAAHINRALLLVLAAARCLFANIGKGGPRGAALYAGAKQNPLPACMD